MLLLAIGYVGVGWAVGAATIALLRDRAVRRRSVVSMLAPVLRPMPARALATLLGLVVLSAVQDEVLRTVTGALAAVLGYWLAIASWTGRDCDTRWRRGGTAAKTGSCL